MRVIKENQDVIESFNSEVTIEENQDLLINAALRGDYITISAKNVILGEGAAIIATKAIVINCTEKFHDNNLMLFAPRIIITESSPLELGSERERSFTQVPAWDHPVNINKGQITPQLLDELAKLREKYANNPNSQSKLRFTSAPYPATTKKPLLHFMKTKTIKIPPAPTVVANLAKHTPENETKKPTKAQPKRVSAHRNKT